MVWRDGAAWSHDPTLTELREQVHDPHCLVWVDLVRPTPETLAEVAVELGLQEMAVEDALAPLERPKVTRHESHLFFMTYATRLRPGGGDPAAGRLELARIAGFVLPTALVTVRLDDSFDIEEVRSRWEENSDLLRLGPGALVHGLLDVVVDGHFATIQELDDRIESLEDVLFAERPTGRAFVQGMFGLRKDLVQLRRVILPMREEVNALLRHRTGDAPQLDSWYDDLYDHVLRAAEWTESLRDMVTTTFETHLSLQDARLNIVMKKLAGWAAIIAVPTAVTGWFGQNIPFPGFASPVGLWWSLALILGCSGALYVIFRRRDWL